MVLTGAAFHHKVTLRTLELFCMFWRKIHLLLIKINVVYVLISEIQRHLSEII
jgi:hypothetical protein